MPSARVSEGLVPGSGTAHCPAERAAATRGQGLVAGVEVLVERCVLGPAPTRVVSGGRGRPVHRERKAEPNARPDALVTRARPGVVPADILVTFAAGRAR
jgi:hypothetical protein